MRVCTRFVLGSIVLASVCAARGDEQRAWLGVYLGDRREAGIAIVEVYDGGPADRGGLRDGDVLVSLDDAAVSSLADVARFLGSVAPGTAVEIEFVRAGARSRSVVTLAPRHEVGTARTAAAADAYRSAISSYRRLTTFSGLSVVAIPQELRRHYGAPGDAGILVTAVEADSAAAAIGLEVGDVIVRVGETAIRTPRDLHGAPRTAGVGTPATLRVVRNREALDIRLEPAPPARTPPYVVGDGPGTATSVRTKLLQTELERLERRIEEIREQLERLKEAP